MPKRLTLEEVQNFIQENDVNNDCILLSTEYINVYQPLIFYCNSCGKIFTRDLCHLKQRKVFCCQECARKRQGQRNALGIEAVQEFIAKYDVDNKCTLLSTEYKNSGTPLRFRCNLCGQEFERDWNHIRRKRFQCPQCGIHQGAIHKIYTKEDVMAGIAERGYRMIGEYTDAATPFQAICKRGHNVNLIYTYYLRHQSGCAKCAVLDQRGPGHPNWKGGTSEVKDYLRKGLKQWKRDVLIRDGFRCALSGIKDRTLVIHHIESFNSIVQQASENTGIPVLNSLSDYENDDYIRLQDEVIRLHTVDNGITLIRSLHDLFHDLYGRGDNTKEQFNEFCKRYSAGEFDMQLNEKR